MGYRSRGCYAVEEEDKKGDRKLRNSWDCKEEANTLLERKKIRRKNRKGGGGKFMACKEEPDILL